MNEAVVPDPFGYLAFHSGMNCGKARCEPGWSWRPAPMRDFDLWYALNGTGEIFINGTPHRVHKGACFLLRPGDRVSATQHPDDRLGVIFIHFSVTGPRDVPLDPETLGFPPRLTLMDDTYHFERDLHRLLELPDRPEPFAAEEFHHLMQLIFLQLRRAGARPAAHDRHSLKHKQLVHHTIDRIRDRIGQPIDHRELAELAGLSPRYVSNLFKQYTGHSLKAYITRMRMERAKLLLAETSMNITQAAEAVGYNDIYFFSKLFRSLYGVPPSHFRRNEKASRPHKG
ncbi:helix-turn-helix domain-containing protein [Paenibacillus sp. MBLB4367]|uniref:helix-turn-helix transcriptional regulator n=1 Tax=Paenibacillus sp. MBLB4367 TaxID=3384767 RepID=UPI003907EE51